jgi:hypothetical protein
VISAARRLIQSWPGTLVLNASMILRTFAASSPQVRRTGDEGDHGVTALGKLRCSAHPARQQKKVNMFLSLVLALLACARHVAADTVGERGKQVRFRAA